MKTKMIGNVEMDLEKAKALVAELSEEVVDYGIEDNEKYFYINNCGHIEIVSWDSHHVDIYRHNNGIWKEAPSDEEVRNLKRLHEIITHEVSCWGSKVSNDEGLCIELKKSVKLEELKDLMNYKYTYLKKK